MRPRIFALLAVSAIALVGCAQAEVQTAEPSPQTPKAIPSPTASSAAPQAEEPKTEEAQEDAFLTQLSNIKEKADQLDSDLKVKAADSYLIKRGEKYCELLEESDSVSPMPSQRNDTTDYQIESMILNSAMIHLCPEASN